MSYCYHCGAQLAEKAKFCQKCGTPLKDFERKESTVKRKSQGSKLSKCPNCGEMLPSFAVICPSCGLELRDVQASSSVREFAKKLEEIEKTRKPISIWKQNTTVSPVDRQKIDLVKYYSIPNTKEDMLEFLILATSNVDYSFTTSKTVAQKEMNEAWISKISQAQDKAHISFGTDAAFIQRIDFLCDKHKNNLKKRNRKILVLVLSLTAWIPLLVIGIIVSNSISSSSYIQTQEQRLSNIESLATQYIAGGDYLAALQQLAYLYYSPKNENDSSASTKELVQKWDNKRIQLINEIKKASENSDILLTIPIQSSICYSKTYSAVADLFKRAGFVNVQLKETRDLLSNDTDKENYISEITIDGINSFNEGEKVSFNSEIIIIYHSLNIVSAPDSESNLKGKNYQDVKTLFLKAGFFNIELNGLEDLSANNLKQDGIVTEISIDGNNSFNSFDSYFADAKIVIRYHSQKEGTISTNTNDVDNANNAINNIDSGSLSHSSLIESEESDYPSYRIEVNNTIEEGTAYSCMLDTYTLYVAKAISDSMINIDLWKKSRSSSDSVSYESSYGVFKINDIENGFSWLDENHTVFTFNIEKQKEWVFWETETLPVIFTIDINDANKNKGSDYNQRIRCYSFKNDDHHKYLAIPLTDSIIKIECWYDGGGLLESFHYGYDVSVFCIDNNIDFEWTNEQQTAFTMIMNDSQNSELRKNTRILLTIEDENAAYQTVKEYLENS